ncbi:hypothetical protein P3S67_028694 [Capsicum chacoense]
MKSIICGSEHILDQNPHATTKVLGEYFRSSFPDGKGPLTRLMANQILINLGVLFSYWKVYTAMGIAKDLFRGTLEHGYKVLDDYRYMIESINPKSKTTLHLDKNGRHPSIPKMGSLFITSAYFGCCIRHLGENIRNNNHNERVVKLFYRAAKAYSREEFLDHFNQIVDVNPKQIGTIL